jgi:hypothetical protein
MEHDDLDLADNRLMIDVAEHARPFAGLGFSAWVSAISVTRDLHPAWNPAIKTISRMPLHGP